MSGTPARGYSWPPFEKGNTVGKQFEPGNTVALRHGATSPRKVDPLAVEIVEGTRPDVTWWRPADEASIWAWGRLEARIQLLNEYLADRGGDIDDDGSVRPAAEFLRKLEARAESMRGRLGLDPLNRARLGRDVAAQNLDLARLWAAQEAEEAAKGTSDGAEARQESEDDDAAA